MAKADLNSVLDYLRRLVGPPVSREADATLLSHFIASRDQAAFAALLKRHGPMVFRASQSLGISVQDAEDVVQATFLLLARKAGGIRKRTSVGCWLHGVARRLSLRITRQDMTRLKREHKAAALRPEAVSNDFGSQEIQELLDAALQEVPEKYRAVLIVCCLEGKSQEEAARQLDCPVGTIQSRLSRGRALLQKLLASRGLTLSAAGLGTLLTAPNCSAALSPKLVASIVGAAGKYASGQALAGLVSGSVALLVNHGLKSLAAAKVKSLVLMMTLALAVSGGAAAYGLKNGVAQEGPRAGQGVANSPRKEEPQKKKEPVKDSYGDPLPDGALARLGALRLRHETSAANLVFTPDGKTLVTGGGAIRLWDVATAKEIRQLEGGGFYFQFSPDSRILATWSHGQVTLYETATGKIGAKLKLLETFHDFAFAFAPDGHTVAVAGDQGDIHLLDMFTQKELLPQAGHRGAVVQMALSADGKLLASAGSEGMVRLWDTVSGKELRQIPWLGGYIGALAMTSDGKIVAAPSPTPPPPEKGDGGITLWETATGKRIDVIRPGVTTSGGKFHALAFSPDGSKFAITTSETQVWDFAAKKKLYDLERATTPNSHLAFSPDGKFIVTPAVKVSKADTGEKMPALKIRAGAHAFAWSADGKTLAVSDGPDLHLFDVATGQRRQSLQEPRGATALSFGPGDRVLAAANDKQIVLWDVVTMEELSRLQGHESHITSLLFSPDRKTLYSASLDRTILIWDLTDLRLTPAPLKPTPIVAMPADKALYRIKEASTEVLLEALGHPEPSVRAECVRRLTVQRVFLFES